MHISIFIFQINVIFESSITETKVDILPEIGLG